MEKLYRHRVFVLLSGGVDSTTTLAIAHSEFPDAEFEAVTVDYGQRHKKEAEYAAYQAKKYNADHVILNAQGLMQGILVDKGDNNEAIPNVSYADLPVGISPTYVTFRNGLMLSMLAARAQAWVMLQERLWKEDFTADTHGDAGPYRGAQTAEATIYCGVHADDGVNWAYPDCTPEFIGPMSASIYTGTYNKVRVRAPLLYLTKPAVVREGLRLAVDYEHTWSCYKGQKLHCGVCPTCRSRKDAFEQNHVVDPTNYDTDEDGA